MEKKSGLILKGVVLAASMSFVVGIVVLGFLSRPAIPQAAVPISVFCAPSRVPAGESWVLFGSKEDLPRDLVASAAGDGVQVLEEERLSPKAVAVKVRVVAGTVGKLLRVTSALTNLDAVPELTLGEPPASRSTDESFKASDLVKGKLEVGGDFFIYGYFPAEGLKLAALRIHNRATGLWSCHEHAEAAARKAEEPPPASDDPHFVVVDPLESPADTDGDGVPDAADPPEENPLVPEQLGVTLSPGMNTLDIVGVDDTGNVSWRTLEVFTTFRPEE
jgi:hypothetical protein